MMRYAGQFTYTAAGSYRHGDLARITIEGRLFGPYISVAIHDGRYDSIHTLQNTRFDFKSRDSFADLRSRDSWKSDWVDCFRGTARLVMPLLDSIPSQIDMIVYASWDPAFCVIEFRIHDDFCQFSTRCRPGSRGRWIRSMPNRVPPTMSNADPTVVEIIPESSQDDSSTATNTVEAPSFASTDTPQDRPDPIEPIQPVHVDYARIDTTLNEQG